MIFEKEALDDPSLIRLNTKITISKLNNTNNSSLTPGKTSLSLYIPRFAILKASSLNSNFNLNINTSNSMCMQPNSFTNFENSVSKNFVSYNLARSPI